MPLGIHRRTGQRYPFLDQAGAPIDLEDLPAAMAFASLSPQSVPSSCAPSQLMAPRPASANIVSSLVTAFRLSAILDHVSGDPLGGCAGQRLDLLEELSPATDMRLAGQGYLGWCPFHDDQAPDAAGDPGTPSFYVVHNRRYGWSWRVSPPTARTVMDRCVTASACSRRCSSSMSSARSARR